jgi:hypothetical protein
VRPGLRVTLGQVTRQPRRPAARARKNAAELRSPGTRMPKGCSGAGVIVILPAPTETSTPHMRSIRSVWSRLGLGSTTVVGPSAARPARSTADLSCALATGATYSIARSTRRPWVVIGGLPS